MKLKKRWLPFCGGVFSPWIFAAALCFFCCGCGTKQPEPQTSPSPTAHMVVFEAASEALSTPIPTHAPTPTLAPTLAPSSLTTGRKLSEIQNQRYKPIMVSVENSPSARPQVALNLADIIYEAPVEYSITRFHLIFNDEYPLFTGPVRSSRIYFMRLQQEWYCMYIHRGYGGDRFDSDWIGVHVESYKMDVGTSQWRLRTDKKAEHTLMANVQEMADFFYGDFKPEPYERFSFSDRPDNGTGKPFQAIYLNFFYRNQPEKELIRFEYDSEQKRLVRYQDGRIFKTLKPVSGNSPATARTEKEDFFTDNLIVQYAAFDELFDSDNHRDIKLNGTGRCDYFVGGAHYTGFWSRPDYDKDKTTYYLDNGKKLTLASGRTWICIHPDDFEKSPVKIVYADGTEGAPATGDTAKMNALAAVSKE